VSCNDGYKSTGASTIACAADEKEGGISFQAVGGDVTCEEITCDPPSVEGGTFGSCGSAIGDSCSLSCTDGKLEGRATFTCQDDGAYAGSGACVAASCSPPVVPGGGTTSCDGQDSVASGTDCKITCDGDAEPQGSFVCSGLDATQEYSTAGSCVAGAKAVIQITQKVELTVEGNAEEVAQDPNFQNPIRAKMAESYGVTLDNLKTVFTGVNTGRRLQAAGAAAARRLAGVIIIEATITVADEAAAAAVTEKMEDTATLETALVEAAAEAGVTVTGVAVSKPVQATVYVTETPDDGAAAPAPAAKAAADDDGGGGGAAVIGGVVGGIGGLALLGVGFYLFKKKNQSQE